MWIYLNLFAISDGIRRKTKIYEQFQVETEKKSISRQGSADWESKNGKVCSAGRKTTFLSRTGIDDGDRSRY